MKTKYIKYVCGFCVVASLTACDDLFDPALENNRELSEMYSDPVFARGLLDNAFLALPYSNTPESDVATDDAVSNDNDNNYKKMALGSWTSEMNPMEQWANRYHAIQYCNLMLENCDKVKWDYTSEILKAMHNDLYKGQAYALRGLHMFYLLRAHCGMVGGQLMGVPIHLTSEDVNSNFNLPRNTFKECYDQIMADFDEALKYLPEQFGDVTGGNVPAKYQSQGATDAQYNRAFGDLQRGKIDGRIIAAIKAQVALFASSPAYSSANATTYTQAAQQAAAYLNAIGGVSGMQADGWKWFSNTSWLDNAKAADVNPNEIVWRANIEKTHSLEADNYPPTLYGKGRVNPTQNLVDAFPMANGYPITDPASGFNANDPYTGRDPRLKEYILVNGEKQGAQNNVINTAADSKTLDGINRENGASTKTGFYLRKLMRSDMNIDPSQSDDAKNKQHLAIRIRSTEIFLDYAEAANEAQGPKANVGGASFSAYDVIKAIRQRAGVGTDNGDPYLEDCATSQAKMRDLIRNERRLELCFENHRFWDLRRWKASLNETAKGVSITTNNTTGNFNFKIEDVEARQYQNYMYYGPIPYSECMKWSNLQQNDGWK